MNWYRCLLTGMLIVCVVGFTGIASANITVAEYLSLRQQARDGDQIAQTRWRYYIFGLMDGVQAVQAPTEATGGSVFFCIPDGLPMSPKFLDEFLQSALKRLSDTDQLTDRITSPMAVLVALELERAFPCE